MKSEVIDLNSEDTVCEEVGDFPLQIGYAVGALLGDHPVVCGGCDLTTNIGSNKCYKLDETKQYIEFVTFIVKFVCVIVISSTNNRIVSKKGTNRTIYL